MTEPLRKVHLRTWRGLGAPGGWHICVRICNRHGHIKQQLDGRKFMMFFRGGQPLTDVAKRYGLRLDVAEEVLRKLLKKGYD